MPFIVSMYLEEVANLLVPCIVMLLKVIDIEVIAGAGAIAAAATIAVVSYVIVVTLGSDAVIMVHW